MPPQRRSPGHDPLEKTGYRLPRSIVLKVRDAVEAGEAKSQNEYVKRAITKLEGKPRRTLSFEVVLPKGVAGNPVASLVMPHQAQTIPRQRLLQRSGQLREPALQTAIEDRLLDHLGVGFEPDHG